MSVEDLRRISLGPSKQVGLLQADLGAAVANEVSTPVTGLAGMRNIVLEAKFVPSIKPCSTFVIL